MIIFSFSGLNGTDLKGRPLTVNEARPRTGSITLYSQRRADAPEWESALFLFWRGLMLGVAGR
jgi:hypothetical protein